MTPLTRSGGHSAAPIRLLHLGLGNFFRAHQAWYTDRTESAAEWGIAGFGGRDSSDLVDRLNAQDGLYTLLTRGPESDRYEVVGSLSKAHAAADHAAWLEYFRSPDLAAVTMTVTEAGYLRGPDGGLDRDNPAIQADLAALRGDMTAAVKTAPARLAAGLAARHRAGQGAIALVPCDNEAGNGAIVERVVHDVAELLGPGLAESVRASMSVVTTMVDRITPRATPADLEAVEAATDVTDRCPVVTEPFNEWVLSGGFPSGRPEWDQIGATFTDDVTPYEHRKLWLVNGGHSLLAYAGSIRGHETVAEAGADDTCRAWLDEWWSEASAALGPGIDFVTYRSALFARFTNPRLRHRLDQIAADGSYKLPIRVLPVVRIERANGRNPRGATRILAAWICHLRGAGAIVTDPRADLLLPLANGALRDAVPRVLESLDPELAADTELIHLVIELCRELLR
ncbi:MAG TPA: mannitol dehydrogenase family protein [Mycobacteriales bacterium]|nr:mannitol dehydrogenase family protein [Mycobacteriales bacterium]